MADPVPSDTYAASATATESFFSDVCSTSNSTAADCFASQSLMTGQAHASFLTAWAQVDGASPDSSWFSASAGASFDDWITITGPYARGTSGYVSFAATQYISGGYDGTNSFASLTLPAPVSNCPVAQLCSAFQYDVPFELIGRVNIYQAYSDSYAEASIQGLTVYNADYGHVASFQLSDDPGGNFEVTPEPGTAVPLLVLLAGICGFGRQALKARYCSRAA